MKRNIRAQIWVETVVYTLIGLAIIGILLAVSKPKIDEMKDGLLIENTIDSMNKIDAKMMETYNSGVSNRRYVPSLDVSKGRFTIDAINEKFFWTIESEKKYSEPGENVSLGRLNVLTEEGNPWTVTISIEYPFSLTYNGEDRIEELDTSPTPYKLFFLNKGTVDDGLQIDITSE